MVIARQSFTREPMPIIAKASLSLLSCSHTLRCDAKQSEKRFADFQSFVERVKSFHLGKHLPDAFVKGTQPRYLEGVDATGVPVISTIVIQDLSIRTDMCRHIRRE